jgi:hypothetical protein
MDILAIFAGFGESTAGKCWLCGKTNLAILDFGFAILD